jgi:hypothetical protein
MNNICKDLYEALKVMIEVTELLPNFQDPSGEERDRWLALYEAKFAIHLADGGTVEDWTGA